MGFRRSHRFDHPVEEVFGWHERPGAFTRLAPPWLPARPRTEAASLRSGRATLALPLGLRLTARHRPEGYQHNARFVDSISYDGMASLPAFAVLRWQHEHRFESFADGGTWLTDSVRTVLPVSALSPVFSYRNRQLAQDLASHEVAQAAGLTPQTIAITGASGLVGQQLSAFLSTGGHSVIHLVRPGSSPVAPQDTARGVHQREWRPDAPAPDLLEGVDAVIHLAGASIFGRFTQAHRAKIRDSRIEPTRALAQLAAGTPQGPRVFISASAIGFYGADRGDEVLSEDSAGGAGFLAQLVQDWENATAPAQAAGLRTVQVRTGLVQAATGGILRVFRPLYALGGGGPLAGGQQWQSWVDLNDLIDIYYRALFDPRLNGPVNAVAPNPVRQREYAQTLGAVLRRPTILPTPAFAPALLLGREGAAELALADQRCLPQRLTEVGHRFRFSELRKSLQHQLGKVPD